MDSELTKRPGGSPGVELEHLPDWMVGIRRSMAQAMKPELLEKIFARQVEKALEGDAKAAKFVFDQARAFSDVKGITLVQNIYQGEPRPDVERDRRPVDPPVMPRGRVDAGNGAFRADGSRVRAH